MYLFIEPWGSTAHVKNVGTRLSQLVACSDYGIFANVSKDCMAWEVYIPTLQKFVTSTHIVPDTDVSKRLVSIEKCDLLLKNSSAMSHTSKAFADGVRSPYSSHRGVRDDLMVQIDPLSGMPIELVPFVDTHENNYVMTSSQVDKMTKPSVSNDGSDQPSVSNSTHRSMMSPLRQTSGQHSSMVSFSLKTVTSHCQRHRTLVLRKSCLSANPVMILFWNGTR